MIAMQQTSAGSLLPIPVLFPIVGSSAARFGRRTPAPHDRPAALHSYSHGDNQRGAVVWEMYTLPSTEDRLKNGIRLSDTFNAFALLDDWLEDNFKGMSQALHRCLTNGINEHIFNYPDNGKVFFGQTDLIPTALRVFQIHKNALYESIKSLLKSGRLTAYGKEKVTDEKWQIVPCHYFSLTCKVLFNENKIIVEDVSFLDVRVTCLEGLPIWPAMVAYGDQELVSGLMQLVGQCRYQRAEKLYVSSLLDDIRSFRKYFCSLMKNGDLKAVYLETDEPVSRALWDERNVSLARSEILTSTNEWRGVKINTPVPPLNDADKSELAAQVARLPARTRGYKTHDLGLVEKMQSLIVAGTATNSHQAAWQVVDRAKGGGTATSKVKRLMRIHKGMYPSSP